MQRFRDVGNTLLVALDGTGYFRSESIHCPQCSVARHSDGRVVYSHSALMAAVVKPGFPQLIPLQPEFISPQDGRDKQDCESSAARRWIRRMGEQLGALGLFLLGEMQFLIKTQGVGRKHGKSTYRFLNDIPLGVEAGSVQLNWLELPESNGSGELSFRAAFITSHRISAENVEALLQAGWCRWKIENEDFDTLKTKGWMSVARNCEGCRPDGTRSSSTSPP